MPNRSSYKACGPGEYDVAVICDWLYPLKPPSVYVEDEPEGIKLPRNSDGSVDVFSASMTWEPGMAAVTMVDYLDEKLDLLRAMKKLDSSVAAKSRSLSDVEEIFHDLEDQPVGAVRQEVIHEPEIS